MTVPAELTGVAWIQWHVSVELPSTITQTTSRECKSSEYDLFLYVKYIDACYFIG